MKKILLLTSLILWSLISAAQVEDCIIKGRYADFYEWNTSLKEYEWKSGDWMTTYIGVQLDKYIVATNSDDAKVIFWEYDKETEDGDMVYYTEDNRKVVFWIDKQKIGFFYEHDDYTNRYQKAIVISKTTKEDYE